MQAEEKRQNSQLSKMKFSKSFNAIFFLKILRVSSKGFKAIPKGFEAGFFQFSVCRNGLVILFNTF